MLTLIIMFKKYDIKIKKILSDKSQPTNWNQVLSDHQRMISIIQHERLIHLLVTIFVGLTMLVTSLATIVTKEAYFLILSVPLILLFLGYIFHYHFLENTTQSWYLIEEEIKSRFALSV